MEENPINNSSPQPPEKTPEEKQEISLLEEDKKIRLSPDVVQIPEDKFSKGKIVKYFPQSRYGFVKNKWGKDVYFNIDEIRFVGDKGREALREGVEVGYDVGWTSHGLHIAKLKIY